MRVLVLGGGGMLGHKVAQVLRRDFDVWATTRSAVSSLLRYPSYSDVPEDRLVPGVDALQFDSVTAAVARARPDVVVNAIGIVKQLPKAQDAIQSILTNALFPHRLATLCAATGARLVHVSTDCVFSGKAGSYTEAHEPDPEDLYGRTKLIGEVVTPGSLTIRTSIIGRDFQRRTGLLEWFVSQQGRTVRGFRRVFFSGLSTIAMAEVLTSIVSRHPRLTGLYHVATTPISKYDLLCRLRESLSLDVNVVPIDEPRCDRSLNPTRFCEATDETLPSWDQILEGLQRDTTPYDDWWRTCQADGS